MEFSHKSVLLNECIENLNIKPDGIYVDGTLGGAGHSYHICERLSKKGRLIGIDQDEDAIRAATTRLEPFKDRVTIVKDNYSNIKNVLVSLGIDKVDGILLDIGVSSYQLDNAERGFTYKEEDAPLDMRMDRQSGITAQDVVNDYSEMELFRVIRDYGEEQFAKNILNTNRNKPTFLRTFRKDARKNCRNYRKKECSSNKTHNSNCRNHTLI